MKMNNVWVVVRNLLLVYVVYSLCRLVFILENFSTFSSSLTAARLWEMWSGGLRFDTTAILYTNALYIVMMLLPLHLKERGWWHAIARWVFAVTNAVCVIANLADCVYFQYTGRRTTATVFSEFSNENNLASIFGTEILHHWYIVLVGLVLIYALWKLCAVPDTRTRQPMIRYYITQIAALAVMIPLCICGMRGGATRAVRPITISNANQYVDRPLEAAIVLNTPFSIIRTFGKKVFVVPKYYTVQELNAIYSPVHTPVASSLHAPQHSTLHTKKNIVVLIVESFGREYIGGYNKWLENGKYKGYTPFVDSLMEHSLTFKYSYCNGRKSIDGMPSILSGIPMFVEPFFLTPAATNNVSGLAKELKNEGYHSAFFHGAENGSMGFQAFARATSFDEYYGRTEYNDDKRTGGDKDFDGTWAIWDEPFLQFYANKMTEMKQPFVTAVFTASSHHPYNVPEGWEATYKYEAKCSPDKLPIHKCIRYTDNALREFFNSAKKLPWYENTLFVITSDHTNQSNHEYYQTDLGSFCSPIILFDPSGSLQTGMRDCIAQQIDIMPTVLDIVGYKRKHVAFGINLMSEVDKDTWAVNYLNGIYQYVKGDYLLQWDGERTKAVYDFKRDSLLKHNLVSSMPKEAKQMEREVKAVIQSYMERMTENRLTAD